jgi:NIMA (never in mitosis gene a)-related kinase
MGTKLFMAPELIKEKSFNEKIDIWAAGCVLCFMLIGKLPQNGSKINVKEYEMVKIINIDDSKNFER